MNGRELLDPGSWMRVGRGRTAELRNLEVRHVVEMMASLPSEWAPYGLVSVDLVRVGRAYEPRAVVIEANDLGELDARGVWQFFLVSRALSPEIFADLSRLDLQTLSINGAVNLQLGRRVGDQKQPAALGHVGKVSDGVTQIEHWEYSQIYEAALRSARRSLRAETEHDIENA